MSDLLKEMFRCRLYKANQGRLVRRLTMIGIIVFFVSGAYKFFQLGLANVPLLSEQGAKGVVAGLICVIGAWFAFRLINWSVFADFLISVEAEMVKVSWPSKAEVYSSTIVVLVMFFLLAVLIFGFDLIWITLFRGIGVMPR